MSVIVNSVLILFALVFLGYYVGKTKMVRVECAPDLSKLLVNILLPLTVFKSMIRPFNESLIKDGALLFILVVIFHGFELIIGLLVTRSLKIEYTRKGVWLFVCLFPNNGFIGFPLAASIYGDDGLFLMAIANVVTNFLIFSLGFWVLTRNGSASHKISLKQMIVNNINLAVVLGLFFYLTQIPLPETLLSMIQYLSNMTAPLSMLVVGLSMSKLDLKTALKDKGAYLLTAMRLLIIPVMTVIVLHFLPLDINPLIKNTIILMSCLPSASSVTIIAEQYHLDTDFGSKAILLTTLFCLVTIPLVMMGVI